MGEGSQRCGPQEGTPPHTAYSRTKHAFQDLPASSVDCLLSFKRADFNPPRREGGQAQSAKGYADHASLQERLWGRDYTTAGEVSAPCRRCSSVF